MEILIGYKLKSPFFYITIKKNGTRSNVWLAVARDLTENYGFFKETHIHENPFDPFNPRSKKYLPI